MLKVKTFVILIIIYLFSFIALKTNVNLFYPYYLLKDLVFFPVKAIEEEIVLDDLVKDGITLEQKKELEELKKINDLSSTLTEFDSVKAMVIERNRMYWFNSITINKGTSSNLKEDMAVISGQGLLGKISKVSKNTSEIKLITTSDMNNKISVMIKTEDDTIYGIMAGYLETENVLQVTLTNKLVSVKEGSLVYTSGMGGIFPSGILIGKVKGIVKDKYDVSLIVQVTPASKMNDFRFVNVLVRK